MITIPLHGIILDVNAYTLPFGRIANDPFIIISLPDGRTLIFQEG
jgi:hypothetical protein